MNIRDKLDRLYEMQAHSDVINLRFDKLRDEILTPEIRAELDGLEAERATALEALNGGISELTNEIKANVETHGATVKASYLMAVYSKPRVSWDTKGLDGFAVAHPELEAFRKVGKPSVSIRGLK